MQPAIDQTLGCVTVFTVHAQILAKELRDDNKLSSPTFWLKVVFNSTSYFNEIRIIFVICDDFFHPPSHTAKNCSENVIRKF